MSIINEALKKAGVEKESDMLRKNMQLEFQKKKPGVNWGPVFVVLVLLLITGPIVVPIFSTPFRSSSLRENLSSHASQGVPPLATAERLPPARPEVTRQAQFSIEETMLQNTNHPPTAVMPDFSLSGIVFSPKDSYCLLNNKIAKVGDTISGAKLVRISSDQVVLDYEGQEIVLSATA